MRIIDRYILKSVLGLFFGCLFLFLFLYVIIDVFSHLEDILKQRIAITILLPYYLAYLPIIFVQVAPITCLLSTIYTFGSLNRNNEIIAMRSAGLSIFQITKTAIIFGIIISAFVFYVNERFVPKALVLSQAVKDQIESGSKKGQKKELETISNLAMYGLRNRLFFVNRFLPKTGTLEGITILEHDEKQNLTKKIVANRGEYKEGFWRFYQSLTYNFDKNGHILDEPQYFEEEIMAIPESPKDFLSQQQQPQTMSIAQLEDYIWKLSKSGATTVIRRLKVDLYQKFTLPLTTIISVLVGIPFSLMMKKRATGLSSVGISIMVGFIYYVLNAVSIALGNSAILPPLLAVSLAHIIIFGATLHLIHNLP